jgi:hypothetical protein
VTVLSIVLPFLLLTASPPAAPFAPGERIGLRITYAGLLAGRAWLSVAPTEHEGRRALELVAEAKSQGFFAKLFRFRVDDRTAAIWDPVSGCSLRIEKHLREGKARRDQIVEFDPRGRAVVDDPKIEQKEFEIDPCSLDILSALFVTRLRGVSEGGETSLPVFDNGRRFLMKVRFVKRETLNLPWPLGRTPTIVVEPQLASGTGLFVRKKGRLQVWLTDDSRRIPVKMRAKAGIGSVSADLESYEPGLLSGDGTS